MLCLLKAIIQNAVSKQVIILKNHHVITSIHILQFCLIVVGILEKCFESLLRPNFICARWAESTCLFYV